MYIDVSFPRFSSSPHLGILVHWLPIDPVLLTEPSQILLLNDRDYLYRFSFPILDIDQGYLGR